MRRLLFIRNAVPTDVLLSQSRCFSVVALRSGESELLSFGNSLDATTVDRGDDISSIRIE